MDHLPHQALALGLARDQHVLAEGEPVAHEGLIKPHATHVAGGAAEQHAKDASSHAAVTHLDVVDHAPHAQELALFQVLYRASIAEVLVVAGEEEQHVHSGAQAQTLQQFRARRPYALEEFHGHSQPFDHRFLMPCHGIYCTAD